MSVNEIKTKCPYCGTRCSAEVVVGPDGNGVQIVLDTVYACKCSGNQKVKAKHNRKSCEACSARDNGTGTEVLGTCVGCGVATGSYHGRRHTSTGEACDECFEKRVKK